MTLKQWAHIYIDAGWSIFPLYPESKEPYHEVLIDTGFKKIELGKIKSTWEPFQTVKATHELVDAWWTLDEKANIGLVCGRISGVTVIDIDYKPHKFPDLIWIDPYELYLESVGITMTSITGSKGLHLFCKYDPGIPNSKGSLHKQIDTKNDRGYVVLPPSFHDDLKGRQYTFDPMFPFNKNNLKNLAPVPQLFIDFFKKKKEQGNSKQDWLKIMGGLQETTDGRDDGGTKFIGKMLKALWIEFNADPDFLPFLWDIMQMWNKKNNPPMSESQLQKIFKSIVSKYL